MKLTPQHRLHQSRSYQLGKQIQTYLDDYYLDGIIGLIPVLGSIMGHLFNLVYLYIALFKLRSARLTVVILFNGLKDMALGFIPILGTILDFFYKSNKKNFELIEQFAAQNPQTIKQVNQQAAMALCGVLILCTLMYYLLVWGVKLLGWLWQMVITGLFN